MDDQFDPPPAVALTSIEVPFGNLVVFLIKFWFANLMAMALIALVPAAIVFAFLLLTDR